MKNKNRTLFAVLTGLHLLLLGYTAYKKKGKVLPILSGSIGMAFLFEYFVLNLFRLYTYYPKVFRNRWIDSVFGALLSQALIVPIKSTFLVAFRLGWGWRIVAGLLFGGVERLFIYKKLYKNVSWSTRYTVPFLWLYFWLMQKWWDAVRQGNRTVVGVNFYLSNFVAYVTTYYLTVAFNRGFIFRGNIFRNKYHDHFATFPLYMVYTTGVCSLFTNRFKAIWAKPLALALLHGTDRALLAGGIIRSKTWNAFRFLPIHVLLFAFSHVFAYVQKKAIHAKAPE